MHYAQQEMVKVMDKATEFAKEFQAELGPSLAMESLAAARAALVDEGKTQVGADKAKLAGTRTKNDLRDELFAQHLVPISRIARTRWDLIPVPKMERFTVPPRGASDVTVLEAARAMAAVSTEYYDVLRKDLGDGFVTELNAGIAALSDAILARDNHRFRRSRATVAIDLRVKEAQRVIAVMTSVVERRLASRPELVAEWRSRTRIQRKPGVPRGTTRGETLASGAPAPEGGALNVA